MDHSRIGKDVLARRVWPGVSLPESQYISVDLHASVLSLLVGCRLAAAIVMATAVGKAAFTVWSWFGHDLLLYWRCVVRNGPGHAEPIDGHTQ